VCERGGEGERGREGGGTERESMCYTEYESHVIIKNRTRRDMAS